MKQLISSRFSSTNFRASKLAYHPSQLPFIAEVRERLQNGEYKLERSACPCGLGSDDVVISEIDRYNLPLTSVLCMTCGTVRMEPYLDQPSLEHFYTHSYQQMYGRSLDVNSYFLKQISYGRKVLSVSKHLLNPGSWVFEVGCGAGGALSVFQSTGYRSAGCDYSAELIEEGRRKGVQNIYYGSLSDIQDHLDGVKADVIYLHHVFEHLQDPFLFLQECRKYLVPNGKVIVIIPDISRIDRFVAPAGDLLQVLHVAHKFNFSFKCLQMLCNRVGYSISRLSPPSNMKTPWGQMPELWVQMSMEEGLTSVENADEEVADGSDMLRYLLRTERLYSLGLCKGQIKAKIERLSPKRVARKIKSFVQ